MKKINGLFKRQNENLVWGDTYKIRRKATNPVTGETLDNPGTVLKYVLSVMFLTHVGPRKYHHELT